VKRCALITVEGNEVKINMAGTMTKEKALQFFAAMMNTLDSKSLEPYLADNFSYSSQKVFAELVGKDAYLDYINHKFMAIRSTGVLVFAEIGELRVSHPIGPCVLIAQGSKENLVATVLAEVSDGLIQRFDMCIIPTVQSVTRSGIYPTL